MVESDTNNKLCEYYQGLYPITQGKVVEYLKGTSFKKEIDQMMRGVKRGFEQGFIVGFSSNGGFECVWDREFGHDFTQSNYDVLEGRDLIPAMRIHAHPLSEGAYMDYVPSEPDITNFPSDWNIDEVVLPINIVGGLVVPGRKAKTWVWQATRQLSPNRIYRLYADWSRARPKRGVSFQDMNDLTNDLQQVGVNILSDDVSVNRIPQSLANLVKKMDARFGF